MKNRAATLTGQMVGRTPWSARDALVPLPGQRYQHHAERQQADGGVGRGPGGPPHHLPEGGFSNLSLVDAWAAAEAAAALALEAARMSDRLDAATASPAELSAEAALTGAAAEVAITGAAAKAALAGAAAEAALTGAAARLFATAHAAQSMVQYARLPDVLGRLMDAQVEAVYLGAESVQRRLLAAAMAAPTFPSRLAAWAAEAGEPGSLRAGLALLGWTLEFLRRARLLNDARQGAGFALADALCRLLAARALAAGVRTLRADGSPCEGFFTDLSVTESAAAASAVAHVSTSLVFGYTAPDEEDLRGFSRLRAAVDASLAGVPAARLRAAAFLLARGIRLRLVHPSAAPTSAPSD
jgi:hypothetical protein